MGQQAENTGFFQREAEKLSELWWSRIPVGREEQRSESCTWLTFPSEHLLNSGAAHRMQGAKQKASEEQRVVLTSFSMLRRLIAGISPGRRTSQNTSGSQLEPLEDYTLGAWSKQPVGRQTLEKIQSKPESVSLVQLRWSAPPICLEKEKMKPLWRKMTSSNPSTVFMHNIWHVIKYHQKQRGPRPRGKWTILIDSHRWSRL